MEVRSCAELWSLHRNDTAWIPRLWAPMCKKQVARRHPKLEQVLLEMALKQEKSYQCRQQVHQKLPHRPFQACQRSIQYKMHGMYQKKLGKNGGGDLAIQVPFLSQQLLQHNLRPLGRDHR